MYPGRYGGSNEKNLPSQQQKESECKTMPVASDKGVNQGSNTHYGPTYEGIGLHDHYDPHGWDYVPAPPGPTPVAMPMQAGQPQLAPTNDGYNYHAHSQIQYGPVPAQDDIEYPHLLQSDQPLPASRPADHNDGNPRPVNHDQAYPDPDAQPYNHAPQPSPSGYPSMDCIGGTQQPYYNFGAYRAQAPPNLQHQPAMWESQSMVASHPQGQTRDQNSQFPGRVAPSSYNSQGRNEEVSAVSSPRVPLGLMTLNSPFNPPAYPHSRPIAKNENKRKRKAGETTSTRALSPLANSNAFSSSYPPTKQHDPVAASPSPSSYQEQPKYNAHNVPGAHGSSQKARKLGGIPTHYCMTIGPDGEAIFFPSFGLDSPGSNTSDEMEPMVTDIPAEEMVMKLVDSEDQGLAEFPVEHVPQEKLLQASTYTTSAPLTNNTPSARNPPSMTDTVAYLESCSAVGTYTDMGMLSFPTRGDYSTSQVTPIGHVATGSTGVSSLQPEGVYTPYRTRMPFPRPVGPQFGTPRLPRSNSVELGSLGNPLSSTEALGNSTHEEIISRLQEIGRRARLGDEAPKTVGKI